MWWFSGQSIIDKHPPTHFHACGQFRVNVHVFGMWKGPSGPGQNPCKTHANTSTREHRKQYFADDADALNTCSNVSQIAKVRISNLKDTVCIHHFSFSVLMCTCMFSTVMWGAYHGWWATELRAWFERNIYLANKVAHLPSNYPTDIKSCNK